MLNTTAATTYSKTREMDAWLDFSMLYQNTLVCLDDQNYCSPQTPLISVNDDVFYFCNVKKK